MSARIKLPFKLGDSKKNNEIEITETLKKEDFSLSEIVRYGFPYRPTTLAYDPVQKILAIGTKNGIIKIYGGAFVECSLQHPSDVEIVQLVFRINEGALISACRDNYIHLWNLRQKKPVIANSLRFVKEKISRCLLPLAFNSKWLLLGTYSGNVYVVDLDTFTLSSYKIMWNNAIGMGKSSHPGVVVDLCQNPDDPTRLYIGFSTHLSTPNTVPLGHVICWNLQQKASESVYTLSQGLTSISWHYEGRQFMCSHCDGSLSVWNLRAVDKPVSVNYPHTRICKDETHKFGAINKVIWTAMKSSGDPFIIFSGGMPSPTDQQQQQQQQQQQTSSNSISSKPSSYFLTILRGQTTNVLHMDNSIIDFHVISPSPHIADIPDPSAIVVLLENDLVVIDLKSENYPLFESLHTLDLHESSITYCDYITEPNPNFYQSLLRLQSKQASKRTYSQQENPISGGQSGSTIFGYNELIITG
jgi:syntaxin-binding protein 5